MADGKPWPKILVVTPSFNQGQYIEETIRSVVLQGYPNLQYVVMDGGSTDASPEIIRRYAPWIDHFEIENDRGQAHAINKGLRRSDNAVLFAFLNSDDRFHPNTLELAAKAFLTSGAPANFWVAYAVENEYLGQRTVYRQPCNLTLESWFRIDGTSLLHQPGMFWSTEALAPFGGFDESYSYAFDRKLFMQLMAAGTTPLINNDFIAAIFRVHEASKTALFAMKGNGFLEEFLRLSLERVADLPSSRQASMQSELIAQLVQSRLGTNPLLLSSQEFWRRIFSLLLQHPCAWRSRFLIGAIRRRFLRVAERH